MTAVPRSASVRAAAAGILSLALLVSACSSDPEPRRTTARDTATPSPSESTTPPPPPQPSLLSGRMGRPNGPVFAVKIDNTAKAHPQQGLSKADVVYVEQVEGGVTRLAAIYSSAYPTYVGPVRSGRITDIELLRQFGGRVGLIYSGSQTKLADNLRRAPLGLVSFDEDRTGYVRASNRPQPYDVIGTFARLRKRAGKVTPPKAPGYTFGAVPAGGKRAKSVTVSYPGARVGAQWSAKGKRYLLSMDGRPSMAAEGGQLGATTLVVQYTAVVPSKYHDINGANTPMTRTVGKGKALFFRDGQVFEGAWSRPKPTAPTTYTIGGQPAVLAPGNLWVTLVKRGSPVTVR